MNPLVKKEIRQLLPGFLLGLLLAFSVLLLPAQPVTDFRLGLLALPFLCCPAVLVMMALDSFGHEMSTGTFSLLLSQPVSRRRIWQIKTRLLAAAALLIWLVWCAGYWLHNPTHLNPAELWSMFAWFALFVLAACSGGLWTVLLVRQVAAAFWFTLLIPTILLVTLGYFLENCPDNVQFYVPAAVFTIYGFAGFLLARRLFLRAQDVAWTGGVISFSRWRYFEGGAQSGVSRRRRRPIAALLKKEFQLQSISLLCAGVLLGLHLAVFLLRMLYVNFHRNSLAGTVSEFFWSFWLVMPLIIGCSAVAEERKLGVADGQFCLPVSRRIQFIIKFIPTLVFGTLLGGIMPLLLESVAVHFGAQNDIFLAANHSGNNFIPGLILFETSIVALSAGLAWAGFFASTLARSFLQTLGIAILTILGCLLFASFLTAFLPERITVFGITPWHSILPVLIAIPTIPAALLWLAWLNFSRLQDSRRLWRRNLLGLAGTMVFVIASSAAIYNRAWEVFEPAEPPHGPAKFSPAAPPKLQIDSNTGLSVRLPDGRVWFDSLGFPFFGRRPTWWDETWWVFSGQGMKSAGPRQFIAGSNWVSATAAHVDWWESNKVQVTGYRDTVGVRTDGTLWISAEAKPDIWTGAQLVRFGDETNWQQVGRSWYSFLLLKKDGTLWRWGTNHFEWSGWRTNWPTVRTFQPRQIGTHSDWSEIVPRMWGGDYAKKIDGSVWHIGQNYTTGEDELAHETNLDQSVTQTLSVSGQGSEAYVGKDGTLWAHISDWEHHPDPIPGFLQIGQQSNWVAVAIGGRWMMALKSDGSLWKWDLSGHATADILKLPPARLGIHSDWTAISGGGYGVVSLAADGSLWLWPNYYELALLKCPKRPQFLANVFGQSD